MILSCKFVNRIKIRGVLRYMDKPVLEQTLVILKPDTIQRFGGEVITRFERVGLQIVAMKMIAPGRDPIS